MSKDMLAPLVRAAVGVPQENLGLLTDIANRLGSDDRDKWRFHLAAVVRAGLSRPPTGTDDLIRIDRSVRPSYPPDWFKSLKHPEFELHGPAEYDLATLEPWVYEEQEIRLFEGKAAYDRLQAENKLERCLNLADGLAIQAKGVETYRRFFGNKNIVLWKSIAYDRQDCDAVVPMLGIDRDDQNQLSIGWDDFQDEPWRGDTYVSPLFSPAR